MDDGLDFEEKLPCHKIPVLGCFKFLETWKYLVMKYYELPSGGYVAFMSSIFAYFVNRALYSQYYSLFIECMKLFWLQNGTKSE